MSGFCEVAVALPVHATYTYAVPVALAERVVVGARVLVPFGGRGVAGVVVRVPAAAPPADVTTRAVTDVVGAPISAELVTLALWIAEYYEAPPGEALRLVQPVGTGAASTRMVTITDAGRAALDGEGGALPPRQARVLQRLGSSPRPLARSVLARHGDELTALYARGLATEDDARTPARTRALTVKLARLAVELEVARAATARAPARRAVVEALIAGPGPVPTLAETLPGAAAAIRQLAKAALIEVTEVEATPEALALGEGGLTGAITPPTLTDEQRVAVAAITDAAGFVGILLHGVTGSGKTEVYLHAIGALRARGKGAIVLVPEISLTPQLAARFRARFGDEVAILHSGLTERERLGEWTRLERGVARIAVGARSAVFAPVHDLGIIVVDEEHDGSFKQDEGVRYHGRDVALVRAQRAGAVCVLGSATPSLESYAAATAGRYQLVTLVARPTGGPLPEVAIVDLRTFRPDADLISEPLLAALTETLAAGDQAIVFLNRRGFATFVMCRGCGHAFRCQACAVSLTYHQASDRLQCHYCGHGERVPTACPKCGADKIERKGLGTERVATALAERFPDARVARLDRDVASGARAEAVLARVARREVDLLVGTQMVTKGHDFPGVTLVGVLCADLALGLPDFRASERTFQLLTQVAGRAGRGSRPGRVLIQTYQPDADAITCAARHDYATFFARECETRAELDYPPLGRVCAVRIDGTDPSRVAAGAARVAELAIAASRAVADVVTVRGPSPAPLARLRGRTRWQVWLRSRDRVALRRVIRSVLQVDAPGATVAVDVDPLSTL